MSWLDRVSVGSLVFASLILGLAPFYPEPHLWQKLKMLADGSLSRPLDIFDLCMHGAPVVVLLLKLARQAWKR
ncbi:MAG: RND transporter [Gemmatimonadota bacterium]